MRNVETPILNERLNLAQVLVDDDNLYYPDDEIRLTDGHRGHGQRRLAFDEEQHPFGGEFEDDDSEDEYRSLEDRD